MSESSGYLRRFFNWLDAWAKNEHLKGEVMSEVEVLGVESSEDVMRKISKDMQDPKNHTVKLNVDMIKNMGEEFHKLIMSFPACREYSLAMTKIEEAVMWAVKGATR